MISSLWFYFFPTIEAAIRKHPDRLSIFLVNLFLGWTLLGGFSRLLGVQKPETG
ncbi:superinfection immunity protein [Orrella marina]|uniref:superinfection immunity protein n=1 Tax=Orrella marina TaxID=2163011 RepID=UPI001D13176D